MTDTSGPLLGIEMLAPVIAGGPGNDGFCVARVNAAGDGTARFAVGDLVLAPAPVSGMPGPQVPASSCIALPAPLPLQRALAVPPLALALWIWDAAGLEPGEIAVYTSDDTLDRSLAVVAGWRSTRDVIRLVPVEAAGLPLPGVVSLTVAEPEAAGAFLAAAMRGAPGAAAAVLSERTDALDLILEAIPMWGRIVLAAAVTNPATVDFYNNVHRKGCSLLSVPGSPGEMLAAFWNDAAGPYIARAARILQIDRLAAACLP